MERAEYHRHSRARMAETAKDASRHSAPDAPERIEHRRRSTRLDHRTCCRGSRGSASLPCHTLRKRVEMGHAGSRRGPHFERNDVTFLCETVHQGSFAEMESVRSRQTWLISSMILNFSPKKLSKGPGEDYGSRKVSANPQLLLAAGRISGRSSHSR